MVKDSPPKPPAWAQGLRMWMPATMFPVVVAEKKPPPEVIETEHRSFGNPDP